MTISNISLKRKLEVNPHNEEEDRSSKRAKVDEETQDVAQGVIASNNSSSNNSQSSSNNSTPPSSIVEAMISLSRSSSNVQGSSSNRDLTRMESQSSSSSKDQYSTHGSSVEKFIASIKEKLRLLTPQNEELKKELVFWLQAVLDMTKNNKLSEEHIEANLLLAVFKFRIGQGKECLEIYTNFLNNFEKEPVIYLQAVKKVLNHIKDCYHPENAREICNILAIEFNNKIKKYLNDFNPKDKALINFIDNLFNIVLDITKKSIHSEANIKAHLLFAIFKFKIDNLDEGLQIFKKLLNQFEKDSIKYFDCFYIFSCYLIKYLPPEDARKLCEFLVKNGESPIRKAFNILLDIQSTLVFMSTQNAKYDKSIKNKELFNLLKNAYEHIQGMGQEISADQKNYIYALFQETFKKIFHFLVPYLKGNTSKIVYGLKCFKELTEVLFTIQNEQLIKLLSKTIYETFGVVFKKLNNQKMCFADTVAIFSNIVLFFERVEIPKHYRAQILFWCAQLIRKSYEKGRKKYNYSDYKNHVLKPLSDCCDLLKQQKAQSLDFVSCWYQYCYALNHYCHFLRKNAHMQELAEYQPIAKKACETLRDSFPNVILSNGRPANVQGAYALLTFLENNAIQDTNLRNECFKVIAETIDAMWDKLPKTKEFWEKLIKLTESFQDTQELVKTLNIIAARVKFAEQK